MTNFGYFVLLLPIGVVAVIFVDVTIGIVILAGAILGMICEAADDGIRYIDDRNKEYRNRHNKWANCLTERREYERRYKSTDR